MVVALSTAPFEFWKNQASTTSCVYLKQSLWTNANALIVVTDGIVSWRCRTMVISTAPSLPQRNQQFNDLRRVWSSHSLQLLMTSGLVHRCYSSVYPIRRSRSTLCIHLASKRNEIIIQLEDKSGQKLIWPIGVRPVLVPDILGPPFQEAQHGLVECGTMSFLSKGQ